MNNKTRLQIEYLLSNPDKLLKKRPFFRELVPKRDSCNTTVYLTDTVTATLPKIKKTVISQDKYMEELNVNSHRVLFDENVPAITIKSQKDGFLEIEQYRMAVPFQVLIRDKQVRHLCVNAIEHTLLNTKPTKKEEEDFVRFKQSWDEKNMEGAKTNFVRDQLSHGDAGLLYFIDSNDKLCTQNISYADGYVIITHKNDEGRHILECLYYAVSDADGNTTEYIDCYDDEYMTRLTLSSNMGVADEKGWVRHESVPHGFSECPLITKRGEVAWERGQRIIESYEALYNTFIVIQKKFGWGILYVKGRFNQNAKKIATSVVLNDTTMSETADAKFLNPPEPSNMIDTLKLMEQSIQKACGTTFILPEDIRISGDASGLAVELTQELDMATAQDGVTKWQNVANKMSRLFKEGLAIEYVKSGANKKAFTDFNKLRINSKFRVWKPKSEEAHNQMLTALYASGNGGISRQTYVEKNTISAPDEMMRIEKERAALKAEEDETIKLTEERAQTQTEETIVTEDAK